VAKAPRPEFLDRPVYRRRRAVDAARLVPILGAVLFLLPLIWGSATTQPATSVVGLYLFSAWGVIVLLAAILARRLAQRAERSPKDRDTP